MSRVSSMEIQEFSLWEKKANQPHALYSFDLEITARCNNNCRHCYINLPAADRKAEADELKLEEIEQIAAQAVEMGALWCLLTGGEPLLRADFSGIYKMLKRKGLLVSVFTNAALISKVHLDLFRRYPPRDIEVTVYGSNQKTYEAVTRRPGSYASFMRGLEALFEAGLRVRLKAMAIRSNMEDIDAIAAFCRKYTKDFYRFDPVLHLRFDGDEQRNAEIRAERLTAGEIVAFEKADKVRFDSLKNNCDLLIDESFKKLSDDSLFHCGAGQGTFSVGYDGTFRLCSSLWAPGTTVNLRAVSLKKAYEAFVPHVRSLGSKNRDFLESCHKCPIINLCLHCPGHAYLETGSMDGFTEYFCRVAHARAGMLQYSEDE